MIQRLLRRGYTQLTGIDYSEKSIELAQAQLNTDVSWKVIDMTAPETPDLAQYDVAIDKGTLDAILLCSHEQRASKRQAYVNTVHRHVKSLLFLVSCNWTKAELLQFLEPSNFF